MNGKIKAFENLGKAQQAVIELLWEQPDFKWTIILKDGFKVTPSDESFDENRWGPVNSVLRTLDSLTKYDVISDIPLEDDEYENGRVIRLNGNGFQYETIEGDITVTDEPQPEVVEEVSETESETPEPEAPKAQPEAPKTKAEAKIRDGDLMDRDAEITALREQLKASKEHIEVLRTLIANRDKAIREAMTSFRAVTGS